MSRKRPANMVEFLVDLPPNILMEILVRLPIESIFAARCVCKTFLNLTTPNPHFTALHASSAPPILIFQFGDAKRASRVLFSIEPELNVAPRPRDCIWPKSLFFLPRIRRTDMIYCCTNIWDENRFVLVNSCNGMLYLVRRNASDERSIVCNPVTNEYLVIPDVDQESRLRTKTKSMWLGFDKNINRYKILRIFTSRDDPLVAGAQVLVIGSNLWRDIDLDTPLGGDDSWDTCYGILDGVIYWLDPSLKGIAFFNFATEKFGEIEMPCEYGDEEMKSGLSIGLLGDCLCLSYNDCDNRLVDLWVMRKNGKWSKEFVIDAVSQSHISGWLTPLQVLRNGEILMYMVGNDLVRYDPRNKSLRYSEILPLRRDRPKAVTLTPSFASLKDILMVAEVIVHDERPS